MTDKLKEISSWLLEQGIGITRDVLNEKLEEAYKQGQLDGYHEQVETTLDNILSNTMLDIDKKKKVLFEKNFYNVSSEEDAIEMRVYEYLTENLPKIVKAYRES